MSPPQNSNVDFSRKWISSVLPEYLCRTLPYKSFNNMQAECLETWESDVNMLISAPTGSGKTVCFELAILRVLHQAISASQQKRLTSKGLEGKIVYIAPTKSLCSERARDWQRKFEGLGLRVQAMTGDVASSSLDITPRNTDLIVATAEKWDSFTRNLGSKTPSNLSAQVRLLLLDEVHQVGDSRGAVFESVVTRMLIACDTSSTQISSGGRALPAASLRIIAVSATVSNISDISKWLRVSEANTKVFDETYRPVELEYHVLGYKAANPWLYGKVYDSHLPHVIAKYGEGKPCIVFCTSRRQTAISAQALLNKLTSEGSSQSKFGNQFVRTLSEEQKSRLISCSKECGHTLLTRLLPHGIGMHNADMNARTRGLVETMFRDSLIGCLFSTSTLAQGVNLPARLVVIAGTTIYNDGCLAEYRRNLLLQMCGRAGRPGLDSKGVVVIMTALPNVGTYERIRDNSLNVLSSQLAPSISESINAEIARQVITDVPSAISFLSSTLFWAQLNSSSTEEVRGSNLNEETKLHSVAVKAIDKLCDTNLVQYDVDHFGLSCTQTGVFMARYCLSVDTMRLLIKKAPDAAHPSQILRIVASCTEVQESVSLRRADKKRLNVMNEWIRMPVKGKVQETTDKIVILLQVLIGDQKSSHPSDIALRSEGHRLLQPAARVSACLIAMVLRGTIRVRYETAVAVLHVCRGVQNKCLWDGPTVLRQVPGISISDMRVLNKAGIISLTRLSHFNAETLELELGCRPALADTIEERLRIFPRFVVKTEVLPATGATKQGLSIAVSVDVVSLRGNDKPRQRRSVSCFILIGSPSVHLLACHVFPLNEGKGSISCSLPQEGAHVANGWIDVLVGCDSLCGTDVIKRIWSRHHNQTSQPASRQQNSKGWQDSKHRLSVTAGRVTKKLYQAKLGLPVLSSVTQSAAQMAAPQRRDDKGVTELTPSRESDLFDRVKSQLNEGHAFEKANSINDVDATLKPPTSVNSTTEMGTVPKPNEQLMAPKLLRKPKQTPARSETHIALLSYDTIHNNGKEYDDVFRGLF